MPQSDGDLAVGGLTKDFVSDAGRLTILNGVDLSMRRGEALAVTGPSGSGKSTLLHILGMLDRPTAGTVRLLGEDPFARSDAQLAGFRNTKIGFIFQDHHLLPQCDVLENVLIPALAGAGAGPAETQRATQLLERVGLKTRMTHRPAQLSGGERQRVAVCRALINQPVLLLADEPTGNLDRANAEAVGDLLLELNRVHQTLLICVTHSAELAARFPRRAELVDGHLVDR
ncbi:MAG TPA: ABC transporter ATP-binding protein [Planctomycetaceae bacterium]|jgi:lipoprotein-releasing system ATP-binding protein|nr:ABC transporter ATP-binding protein [Planctomycetaceae bacterium]